MRISILFPVLALLPRPALAAEWADFASAFPLTACQDGWAACRVGDEVVNPELRPDPDGRLLASDLRVGWFDLDVTPVFSPWTGLSEYPYDLVSEPDAVAEVVVDDGGEERSLEAQEPGPSDVAVEEGPGQDVVGTDGPGPSELSEARVEVEVAGDAVQEPDEQTIPDSRDAVVDADETVVREEQAGGEEDAGEEEAVTMLTVAPSATTCDNLQPLELKAMMGRLSAPEIGCIESTYQAAAKQTDKDKVSRVLIANANASDRTEWARLVARHLDEVDRSDPNMSYAYAKHLLDRGSGRAEEAIYWADIALERRQEWVGETHKSRVVALYKVRALAAQEVWTAAEQRHATAPTDQTGAATEEARGRVKTFAREWYDYARAAGKDTTRAMKLCVSAAGTEAYCAGRE